MNMKESSRLVMSGRWERKKRSRERNRQRRADNQELTDEAQKTRKDGTCR